MSQIKNLIKDLNKLILSDRVDRKVLNAVHSQTKIRIFTDGKYADGTTLGSKLNYKSPKKGAYSKAYANKRLEKGRPINKINLQMGGDLMNDWKFIPVAVNQYGGGFTNNDLGKISEKLEELYKGSIFSDLTKDEENLLEQLYEKELSAGLN